MIDAKELERAYASVEIPDLVWDDLKRDNCFFETTLIAGPHGVDVYETMAREGARAVIVKLEKNIAAAKRTRQEPTQTHAESSTRETT